MTSYSQRRLQAVATRAAARSDDATRHKCFVSYHQKNESEVEAFIEKFGEVFIAKVLGVSNDDDFVNSTKTDYVMRQIRETYLTDSTVTLVMIGKCTWARRYVDWEIAATLRNDPKNKRSGLLGIVLPSASSTTTSPRRLNINVPKLGGKGYARRIAYPGTKARLKSSIEDAFTARSIYARYSLIKNPSDLFKYNRTCP